MTDKSDKSSNSAGGTKLKELLVRRSSIKGQITKFKNYLSQLENEQLTNINLTELRLKVAKFETLSLKFDELQGEIEVLNSENISFEIDERDSIEREIIFHLASAKNLMEVQVDLVKDQSICCHDHQEQGFKLPQIQISKFDGAFFRWLEFRDTFESLIHNNNRITPIHKFHYLISYLEGDAARIISNLEVSSSNYSEAWNIICKRYNNKRSLINHHLKSLFNIQPITRESDRSLRFLVDHVTKNLRALASLDQPTNHWDILLIFMLTSKLDNQTLTKWEEYRNTLEDVPTLSQFNKFLTDRADVLESLSRNKVEATKPNPSTSGNSFNNNKFKQKNHNSQNHSTFTKSFAATNQKPPTFTCIICNGNHKIYDCVVFKSKSIKDRLADVSNYKLCCNCLRQGHPVSDCRMGPCRECKQRHNTLLHNTSEETNTNVSTNTELISNFSNQCQIQILLSTAIIEVCNPITKQKEKARALLDCGSQSSFISSSLVKKLSLNTKSVDAIKVIGIGNNHNSNVTKTCLTNIKSTNSQFELSISCFVLNNITSEIPKTPVNIQNLNLPKNISLADPSFYQPAKIDLLFGADVFWEILGDEQCSLGDNMPKLRNSRLGWLISGPMISDISQNYLYCNHSYLNKTPPLSNEIDEFIPKFWEMEELPKKRILSKNEKICENHFVNSYFRLETGRFCVKLPLIDTPDCLGDSYNRAKKRLINLEKRFKRNPSLKLEYTKFIDEYSKLGHLSESKITKPYNSYFLCHHAVLKVNSESTKLRVVFDGSATTSSGFSLNDILMVGPNIQDSLFSILIRSRQYRYLLSGDIEKMYRQVQVHEDDRNLQLILWRGDESEPIKTLKLNTVTYGTASASYLSIRCLWQLGEEHDDELIKTIIQKDFYVDDLYTGSDDENELQYIQKSVTETLNKGCFTLRKFKSNSKLINESINNSDSNLTISESASSLGLGWNPVSDCLNFPLKDLPNSDVLTKRYILSNSYKIFDPLGLLSPCIIQPKMMLQSLWQLKLDWDQPVPEDIKKAWYDFSKNLNYLQSFQIPRLVLCVTPKIIELHSFSDASQKAYGACIYVRSIDSDDNVTVHLLCSKSKVAPIKPTTMPRLELSAALLAAKLCTSVLSSLRYTPSRTVHWCDSSIVLAWIKSDVTKLKAFVANRINEIQDITSLSSWRYVPTKENPADLISRGVNPKDITSLKLWWSGPNFLTKSESEWPFLNSKFSQNNLPELKCNTVVTFESVIDFNRFSKLNRMIRTFAYVKRFIQNSKANNTPHTDNLTLKELDESFIELSKIAQKQSFSVEYNLLLKGKPINVNSKLLALSPFLDKDNVMRVGGRLESSDYSFERKHPILLHSTHPLTKLFFEAEHLKHMHAGPQLLLAVVRETIWPVNGRYLARRTVFNCVMCRRARGKTLSPKMGNLPPQRITPDFPFLSVGLDFAGPFYILNRRGRGAKLIKCYLCLFVCLRYKCIHLEVVSDLSKNAFVMTLRRFIARRGKPAEIFCDNGRNFVAAAKEIKDFIIATEDSISHFANQEKIKFRFSPPYAPHFGGIWEAGVKSAKFHLKRMIGNSHLTFEEILTLFAQIEAILNSRPLCPLSSSPEDFHYLSPGHFLIGRPLTSLPAPDFQETKDISLQRYQRIEKIRQHFWARWQKEYVAELQQRTKWWIDNSRIKLDDLVIIQEDNIPPLCWRLGRVVHLYTGSDNIHRVADLKTAKGLVRRPLVRLCPLPTAEELNS